MNTELLICDDCEVGSLRPSTYADDFMHRGGTIHVTGLESYLCDQCGADPVFADQARRNHCKINDARRLADGMLTGAQVREIRSNIGLTQAAAGELIGGGPMAFSKYERGEVIQSAVMDNFLRVLAVYPFVVDTLRQWADDGVRLGASGEYQTLDVAAPCVRQNVSTRILPGTLNVVEPDCWKYAA